MNRLYLSLIIAPLFLAAACGRPYQEAATFELTPGRPDARLAVETSPDKVVIQVFSDSGIGSADVEVTAGPVPKTILLRFHLRGLEELRFSYANITVVGSIASTKRGGVREELRDNSGKEQAMTPESPYWLKVSVVSQTDIPVQDGYIDVEAPPDFAASGSRRFSVQWIDFYR
jgi:hypothetical protein